MPGGTVMRPVLSILMPALSFREQNLADKIRSQIENLGSRKRTVEFLTSIDSGEKTSGQKRQALFDASSGERVCFVDDDDDVHEHYVEELAKSSVFWSDCSVITFNLRMTSTRRHAAGRPINRHELWKFGLWGDRRSAGMMSANHLCAWRRDIAGLVAWDPTLGYADDQMWYQPILNHPSLCLTSKHIDIPLYSYRFSYSGTINQRPDVVARTKRQNGSGTRCFIFDDRICIEVKPNHAPQGMIACRDNKNSIVFVPESLTPYHVIKIL